MRPEILAPAGNRAMADAAMAAGCDALYCAAPSFGARAFADNFTEDELEALISDAHRRGVRVFLTVNTLLHDDERDEAIALLERLSGVGLDAVIVQDLGLNRVLRRALPTLERHASTQMSVTSLAGARELEQLGFSRVILGRETPIEEVEAIVHGVSCEVEVFVHGSLCVSVSGQCYLSAFQGGRSGNRGACAQPCRKTYTLERADGKRLGTADTYLSPRDLMTLEEAPRLVQAGVSSFKIEGRMKKPEYVYAAVSAYRAACENGRPDAAGLRLMTNRPFTKGFLFGDFGRDFAFTRTMETGDVVGTIVRHRPAFGLALSADVAAGDILMLHGRRSFPFTVTEAHAPGSELPLSAKDLHEGDVVRRVYTSRVRDALEEALARRTPKTPVAFTVDIAPEKPIHVMAQTEDACAEIWGEVVQTAQTHALDEETVRRAFQKLGASHYTWGGLTLHLAEHAFLTMGALNAARRAALVALEARWKKPLLGARRIVNEGRDPLAGVSFAARPARTELFLRTDRAPEDFPDASSLDGVILTDPDCAPAWKARGVRVEWEIPALLDHQTAETLAPDAHDEVWDGFSVRTLNEWAIAHAWNAERSTPLTVTVDYGFNLWNEESLRALEDLSPLAIEAVTLSPELSFSDMKPLLKTAYPVQVIVAGPNPGMLLRHCPASALKGCTTDAACATCALRREIFLCDAVGRRPVRRHFGFTEVEAPTRIDWRAQADALLREKPARILIRDDGEQTVDDVAFWMKKIRNER
ncbi:MAG: DUF3656 domain-containing protein [Peptoniphilaceae bacterium]|nr:DUF3656 domain-containing protein [Peptoniphilaceae bacterium]